MKQDYELSAWVPISLLESRLDGTFNHPKAVNARSKIINKNSCTIEFLSNHIACGPFGSTLTASEHDTNGEIVLIQPTDISEELFSANPGWKITRATLVEKNLPIYPPNCLLFARVGIYPHVGVLPYWLGDATISSSMIAVEVDPEKADPYFLLIYFRSEIGQTLLYAIQKITAQPTIGTAELSKLLVPNPNIKIQKAIGNKIRKAERLKYQALKLWDLATKRLEEQIGLELIKDTFENFPIENVNNADYNCISINPASVWARTNNDLGAQNYHPRRLNAQKIASLIGSYDNFSTLAKRITKKNVKSVVKRKIFLGLDSIDSASGIINLNMNAANDKSTTGTCFQSGDILFSRLRPYLNKVTIWPEHLEDAHGSGELLIYRPNEDIINSYYLFFILKSFISLYQIIDVTTGSTHPRVDFEVVNSIRIPRIGDEEEKRIGDLVSAAITNWYQAQGLIPEAKLGIEKLIDGTADISKVVAEGEIIQHWLDQETPDPIIL
jgi:type I restriction enzyme S subunit